MALPTFNSGPALRRGVREKGKELRQRRLVYLAKEADALQWQAHSVRTSPQKRSVRNFEPVRGQQDVPQVTGGCDYMIPGVPIAE